MKKFKARTENANLWAGLGTQYTSIAQVINELVDNSISNFKGNPQLKSNSIIICLEELYNNKVKVSVEDSGTGIDDFENAFGIGAKAGQSSPLNEHGFGMKQALAAGNPSNDDWRLCTKVDSKSPTFEEVCAPYYFDREMAIDDTKASWPGQLSGTGTYVEFTCSADFIKTISRGLKGNFTDFNTFADLLFEDLGFTYARILSVHSISIKFCVTSLSGTSITHTLGAVEPQIKSLYAPGLGDEKVNYDPKTNSYVPSSTGALTIHYEFLEVEEKDDRSDFDNTTTRRYYKANMSTSGIEIRFNGRAMRYNVFSDVWNTEKHNSYNSLLVIVDLLTDKAGVLPGTTTSKNGLNEGDEKLEALYKWIRTKMPNPIKSMSKSTNERELFEKLKQQIEKAFAHSRTKPSLSVEQRVWHNICSDEKKLPRIDLYECTVAGDVNVYEGKYNKTDSQDVYQLKMYWDGLVNDGITPTQGILLADEHPSWVIKLVAEMNKLTDANGNNYDFVTDTWKNLGVK